MTTINVQQTLNQVLGLLDEFTADSGFLTKITTAFGDEKAANITSSGLVSALNTLPAIDIRSSDELNGALGAFSSETGKIYLSEGILSDQNLVIRVLLEEIGHFLDNYFGGADAAGDEGAIFSALVLGDTLEAAQLTQLKQEDDHGVIVLDGAPIAVEMATFIGTNGNDTITGTAGDDTISPLRGIDTVDGGAGNDLLIVDYSSNTYTGSNAGMSSYRYSYFQAYYNSTNYDRVGFSNIDRFQITGTFLNDHIETGDGNDTINGGAGNDDINGYGGNNTIDGGDGNDNITTTNGNDTITGGLGNDTINGGDGNNTINGGDGNDSITTGNGDDVLIGGAGDDYLNAGEGNATIDGGEGIDYLVANFFNYAPNNNFILDVTTGTSPIVPIAGTSIANIEGFNLTTAIGNDNIKLTGRFNDNLSTTDGDDTISAALGIDTVNGGAGDDLLIVDYSSNTYTGSNAGMDSYRYSYFQAYYNSTSYDRVNFSNIDRFQITGTFLNDHIETGDGKDTINGGAGNDAIYGYGGDDIIIGVNPNSINPGKGEIDSFTGGSGSDRFILGDATWIGYDDSNITNAGTGDYAQITDFNTTDDIIQLRGSSSDYLLTVSGSNTNLYINKPGSEPDELIAVLQNISGLNLTASYFQYATGTLPDITLAVSPASVNEDGTNNLVYTFTRTGILTNALTVNYTIGGTASNGTDYTTIPTSVNFAPNSNTATLIIDPTADTFIEPHETVSLTIATGTAYTIGTTTAVTGTILNDDIVPNSPDFNSDGNTDLLWRNSTTGQVVYWYMNNTTINGNATVGTAPLDWKLVGTGKFNNDNRDDLLWHNTSTGQVGYWYMDNNNVVGGTITGFAPLEWKLAGTGDFNKDNRDDLLWRNTTTGQVAYWYMDNTNILSGAIAGSVSLDWKLVGTGDFNKDTKDDLLWQNTATGQVVYWYMDNTTTIGTAIAGSAPLDWKLVGARDFNKDGKDDLLWQNSATGQVGYWYMDNSSVLGTAIAGAAQGWNLL